MSRRSGESLEHTPSLPSSLIISTNDTETSDSDGSSLNSILDATIGEKSLLEAQKQVGRERYQDATKPRTRQLKEQQQQNQQQTISSSDSTIDDFDTNQIGENTMIAVHKDAAERYKHLNVRRRKSSSARRSKQQQQQGQEKNTTSSSEDDETLDPSNYQPGEKSVLLAHKYASEKYKSISTRPRVPKSSINPLKQQEEIAGKSKSSRPNQHGEASSVSSIPSFHFVSSSTHQQLESTVSSQNPNTSSSFNKTVSKPLVSTPMKKSLSRRVNPPDWECTPIISKEMENRDVNTVIKDVRGRQPDQSASTTITGTLRSRNPPQVQERNESIIVSQVSCGPANKENHEFSKTVAERGNERNDLRNTSNLNAHSISYSNSYPHTKSKSVASELSAQTTIESISQTIHKKTSSAIPHTISASDSDEEHSQVEQQQQQRKTNKSSTSSIKPTTNISPSFLSKTSFIQNQNDNGDGKKNVTKSPKRVRSQTESYKVWDSSGEEEFEDPSIIPLNSNVGTKQKESIAPVPPSTRTSTASTSNKSSSSKLRNPRIVSYDSDKNDEEEENSQEEEQQQQQSKANKISKSISRKTISTSNEPATNFSPSFLSKTGVPQNQQGFRDGDKDVTKSPKVMRSRTEGNQVSDEEDFESRSIIPQNNKVGKTSVIREQSRKINETRSPVIASTRTSTTSAKNKSSSSKLESSKVRSYDIGDTSEENIQDKQRQQRKNHDSSQNKLSTTNTSLKSNKSVNNISPSFLANTNVVQNQNGKIGGDKDVTNSSKVMKSRTVHSELWDTDDEEENDSSIIPLNNIVAKTSVTQERLIEPNNTRSSDSVSDRTSTSAKNKSTSSKLNSTRATSSDSDNDDEEHSQEEEEQSQQQQTKNKSSRTNLSNIKTIPTSNAANISSSFLSKTNLAKHQNSIGGGDKDVTKTPKGTRPRTINDKVWDVDKDESDFSIIPPSNKEVETTVIREQSKKSNETKSPVPASSRSSTTSRNKKSSASKLAITSSDNDNNSEEEQRQQRKKKTSSSSKSNSRKINTSSKSSSSSINRLKSTTTTPTRIVVPAATTTTTRASGPKRNTSVNEVTVKSVKEATNNGLDEYSTEDCSANAGIEMDARKKTGVSIASSSSIPKSSTTTKRRTSTNRNSSMHGSKNSNSSTSTPHLSKSRALSKTKLSESTSVCESQSESPPVFIPAANMLPSRIPTLVPDSTQQELNSLLETLEESSNISLNTSTTASIAQETGDKVAQDFARGSVQREVSNLHVQDEQVIVSHMNPHDESSLHAWDSQSDSSVAETADGSPSRISDSRRGSNETESDEDNEGDSKMRSERQSQSRRISKKNLSSLVQSRKVSTDNGKAILLRTMEQERVREVSEETSIIIIDGENEGERSNNIGSKEPLPTVHRQQQQQPQNFSSKELSSLGTFIDSDDEDSTSNNNAVDTNSIQDIIMRLPSLTENDASADGVRKSRESRVDNENGNINKNKSSTTSVLQTPTLQRIRENDKRLTTTTNNNDQVGNNYQSRVSHSTKPSPKNIRDFKDSIQQDYQSPSVHNTIDSSHRISENLVSSRAESESLVSQASSRSKSVFAESSNSPMASTCFDSSGGLNTTLSQELRNQFLRAAMLKSINSKVPEIQKTDELFNVCNNMSRTRRMESSDILPSIVLQRVKISPPKLKNHNNDDLRKSSTLSTVSTELHPTSKSSKSLSRTSNSSVSTRLGTRNRSQAQSQSQIDYSSQSYSPYPIAQAHKSRKKHSAQRNTSLAPSEIYSAIPMLISQQSSRSSTSELPSQLSNQPTILESEIPECDLEDEDYEGNDDNRKIDSSRMDNEGSQHGEGTILLSQSGQNNTSKRDGEMMRRQEPLDEVTEDIIHNSSTVREKSPVNPSLLGTFDDSDDEHSNNNLVESIHDITVPKNISRKNSQTSVSRVITPQRTSDAAKSSPTINTDNDADKIDKNALFSSTLNHIETEEIYEELNNMDETEQQEQSNDVSSTSNQETREINKSNLTTMSHQLQTDLETFNDDVDENQEQCLTTKNSSRKSISSQKRRDPDGETNGPTPKKSRTILSETSVTQNQSSNRDTDVTNSSRLARSQTVNDQVWNVSDEEDFENQSMVSLNNTASNRSVTRAQSKKPNENRSNSSVSTRTTRSEKNKSSSSKLRSTSPDSDNNHDEEEQHIQEQSQRLTKNKSSNASWRKKSNEFGSLVSTRSSTTSTINKSSSSKLRSTRVISSDSGDNSEEEQRQQRKKNTSSSSKVNLSQISTSSKTSSSSGSKRKVSGNRVTVESARKANNEILVVDLTDDDSENTNILIATGKKSRVSIPTSKRSRVSVAGSSKGGGAKNKQKSKQAEAGSVKKVKQTKEDADSKYYSNDNMISKDCLKEMAQVHNVKLTPSELSNLLVSLNDEVEDVCDRLMNQAARPNGMFTYRQLVAALESKKLINPSLGKNSLLMTLASILPSSRYKAAKGVIIPKDGSRDTLDY